MGNHLTTSPFMTQKSVSVCSQSVYKQHPCTNQGGRPGRVLVCNPPPPPPGFERYWCGVSHQQVSLEKTVRCQRHHFFFHTMCLYSKYSKFCREFIFVLKQQEKILTRRRATGGLQALTATLTRIEYCDRAGGGRNIVWESSTTNEVHTGKWMRTAQKGLKTSCMHPFGQHNWTRIMFGKSWF